MHYVLFYDYVPDYLERRGALREAHFVRAKAAIDRGELFLGGAFAAPADGAMIVFSGDSPAVAESFARSDPYVTQGLVTRWWVREWTTVVGKDAATPLTLPRTA
ncbi:MAG: YciI-like protein [Hyphomicrobium sp.]|uniref:YciI-like protein n=1 Tax=Hyphomicrobium sp. TaxID=82 RepID=UPI003D0B832B